jgi:glycine oxidase
MNDVVVIGGGVIGCSIAFRLANAGLKVTVVERGRVGCEASRAAAGMLSPQTEANQPGPFFDLCLKSRSMYRQFASELADISGIDVEYRDEGSLCLLSDTVDSADDAWWSWQQSAGLDLEVISNDNLRKIEPSVAESARGAVFVPNDHQVENRRRMDALQIAMKRSDVQLIEGQSVDKILLDGRRAIGVSAGNVRFNAGAVVMAAGCWSSQVLDVLGLRLRLIPAKGQMVAVRTTEPSIRHVIHSSDCYLIPRSAGRILIGATVEYVGFNKRVTAGGIRCLLESAIRLVPSLKNFEITETWSGLRPDTPDHLPVLGNSGIDNLLLATGHFRNGILLAPVTAELIAQQILEGHPSPELIEYSIERFNPARRAAERVGSG